MHTLSLPSELTVVIFTHLVNVDPPRVLQPGRPLGWINTTFVCRKWRELAINYPMLWTDMSGTLGSRWLDAFLERSQGCLITLRDFDGPERVRYLDNIVELTLHRVRYLSVEHPPSHSVRVLFTSRPVPELRECRFVSKGDNLGSFVEWDASQGNSPELFAGDAPQLRKLTLQQVPHFPWNSAVMVALTSLSLSYMRLSVGEASKILSSMRRMQGLEDLTLFCSGRFEASTSTTHVVELSKLRHLVINADHALFRYVYHHLRYPRAARLNLTSSIRDQTHTRDGVDGVLSLVMTHHSRRPIEDYKTIGLWPGSELQPSLHVVGWEEEFPLAIQAFPVVPFTLAIWPNIYPPPRDIPERMLSTLRFQNAHLLNLGTRTGDNGLLLRALEHLPNIATLCFQCRDDGNPENIRSVLSPLGTALAHPRPNGRRDPTLPKLRTLAFPLEHYGLMNQNVGGVGTIPRTSLPEVLRLFVVHRKHIGRRLHTIYVHSSRLRADPTGAPLPIPSELEHILTDNPSKFSRESSRSRDWIAATIDAFSRLVTV